MIELRLQCFAAQPFALPLSEIHVLDREFCERRSLPRRKSAVEFCHLLHEDPQRPAVTDDVVHHDYQRVLSFAQTYELGAQQWALREIEGTLHRFTS